MFEFRGTYAGSLLSNSVCVVAVIAVPWLNPVAYGPSPGVVPWLVSLAAVAALLLLSFIVPMAGKTAAEGRTTMQYWIPSIAAAWIIAGVASSIIALLQYFGTAATFSPWINQAPLGEAFANLRQRNQFASLTNIALVALIWLGVKSCFTGQFRWLTWAAAGLLAAGNAASSSRTGLLQLALLCALCGVWGRWRQPPVRRILLVAVLVYGLATMALPWLAGFELLAHGMFARLHAEDAVCVGRLTLWSNILHLIAQKPWLGWGWGELDYAHYVTLYPGVRFCDILDNAHNLPLHLAVELGIPMALMVCGTASWIVWHAKPWRDTDATRQMAWGVLAVIILHSMLEYPLWYGSFQMAAGLCLWILWATSQNRISGFVGGAQLAPIVRAGLFAILFVAVSYAAWDYHRISQIYLASQDRDKPYRENTMAKILGSWLFRNQVQFAALTTTPLNRDNAQWTFDTAMALLHYSPEPRVIEKVIESAVMLNRDDDALLHLVRYHAAFPQDHAKWRDANAAGGNGRRLF